MEIDLPERHQFAVQAPGNLASSVTRGRELASLGLQTWNCFVLAHKTVLRNQLPEIVEGGELVQLPTELRAVFVFACDPVYVPADQHTRVALADEALVVRLVVEEIEL